MRRLVSYDDAIDAAARSTLEFATLYGRRRMFPACLGFMETTIGRAFGVDTAQVEHDVRRRAEAVSVEPWDE